MTKRNYDDLSDKPLTPRERRRVRETQRAIDRMQWLGALFLKIVGIVAATGGAITVLKGWFSFRGA
jgi:hypothetical protein